MGAKIKTKIESKEKATLKNFQFVEKLDQLIDIAEKAEEAEDTVDAVPGQRRSSSDLLTMRVRYIERYDWFDTVFEEGGKYGTKDVTGKVILPAKYDAIEELYHQLYVGMVPRVAIMNGKRGLVKSDGSGVALTPFEYDAIAYMIILPYYTVKKGDKYGIVGMDGRVIVPCILDEICFPSGNCVMFKADGKYGILDSSYGDLYVEPQFDKIEFIDMEQPYSVYKDGMEGYINEKGEFMTDSEALDYEGYLVGEYNPDF